MGRELKVPKEVEKLARMMVKLEPAEFMGVCKILGVEIVEYAADSQTLDNNEDNAQDVAENRDINVKVRPAEELIAEVFDKLAKLNRTQRRNLMKLLKPATKGR
jgi:hypothetical protein